MAASGRKPQCRHMRKGDMTQLTDDQVKWTVTFIEITDLEGLENFWKHLG